MEAGGWRLEAGSQVVAGVVPSEAVRNASVPDHSPGPVDGLSSHDLTLNVTFL